MRSLLTLATCRAAVLVVVGLMAGETLAEEPQATPGGKPALDRYGDPLLQGAVLRIGTLRWRHSGLPGFPYFAVSPDGKLAAVPGGRVVLLDTNDGRQAGQFFFGCRRYFEGRPIVDGMARGMCFSPDGRRLAVGIDAWEVQLFDARTGKLLRALPLTLTEQEREKRIGAGGKDAMAYSPDGRSLAWEIGGGVYVVDLDSGRRGEWIEGRLRDGASGEFVALDVPAEADGDGIRKCRVLDLRTGGVLKQFEGPKLARLSAAALSSDGRTAAFCGADKVHIWDVESGRERHVFSGAAGDEFDDLEFSPDGTRLTGVADNESALNCTRFVWDARSGAECWRRSRDDDSFPGGFFDNDRLAVLSAAGIRVFDASSGRMLVGDPDDGPDGPMPALLVRFLANGKTIARLTDAGVELFSAENGARFKTIRQTRFFRDWAWSEHEGQRLLALGGQEIRIWDLDRRGPTTIDLGGAWSQGLEFTADGSRVAVAAFTPGERSSWFQIRERTTGRLLGKRELPPIGVRCSRLPGKDVFVMTTSDAVLLVDVSDLQPKQAPVIRTIRTSAPYNLGNVAISAEGDLLAVSSWNWQESIGRCDLYEVASGRLVQRLPQHRNSLPLVAFSPTAPLVAYPTEAESRAFGPTETGTVPPDEIKPPAIHFWDIESGSKITRYTGFLGGTTGLSFSPDGRRLASSHGDSTCLVWETPDLPKVPAAKPDEATWAELAAEPHAALVAKWRLIRAGDGAVSFLAARMSPIAAPDKDRVSRLIDELDAEDFQTRQDATVALRKLGPVVKEALQKAAAASRAVEQADRCKLLLAEFRNGFLSDADQLRSVRAIQALAQIGTPAARKLLAKLVAGAPGAVQTRQAKQALAMLDANGPPAGN